MTGAVGVGVLGGKPLLGHFHQRRQEPKSLEDAVVATDDHCIDETRCRLGSSCVMSGWHASGCFAAF
ncbi:cytidylyltransferase domain-containing protein [Streptomyces tubercidicus]|uniref:cytidylyltransferase domain-containing protein n=1 Tax=Streptomyces tubercidicus TaxID=47759 RepID=UPI003466BDAB